MEIMIFYLIMFIFQTLMSYFMNLLGLHLEKSTDKSEPVFRYALFPIQDLFLTEKFV